MTQINTAVKNIIHQVDKIDHIALNLSKLLKANNMSESDIAKALGIPTMTIWRLITGKTTDPRISTLKAIADYFKVSIDTLVGDHQEPAQKFVKKNRPIFIPILDWQTAGKIDCIKDLDLSKWTEWQPITLNENATISENAFALESRPSMYPRFQPGTIFIIDPATTPSDGDMVLVKIKANNELTLRELKIDPPEWQLWSVVSESNILKYSSDNYEIVGVVLLTLLYNKKIYN